MPALDNQRWEKFCEYIVAGETQAKSYELAFGLTTDSVDSCASELIRKEPVAERILELRKSGLGDSTYLSLKEKRRGLAEVWRTPIADIDENHPLCQKVKRRKDRDGSETVEIEMVDKLGALKLDAQLAGEIGEGRSGGNVMVNVLVQG